MSPMPASGWRPRRASALTGPGAPRGRIHSATPMKGTYDTALTTKHAIAPTLDISTPAIDGPRMRERLNWVELSARPAPIWSCLTIEGTIDWNDGIESASVMPTTTERTMIIHG